MFKLNDIHEKLVETAFLHSLPQWSFYRFLPTAANRRMDAWDAEWERTCKDLIFRARKANTPSPVSHMYEAVEDGRMKMFELLQTCDEILYT